MLSSKKLLLVGSSLGSVHLKNYYNLIKDEFDDILIVTESEIDYCAHKIADFSISKPWKIPSRIRKVKHIIDEFDPDIIHVHQANSVAYITGKANKGKKPLLLTAWGSDVLILPQRGILFKKMVSKSLQMADAITVDADYMASAIRKFEENKTIHNVNFGIELDNVTIPEKEKIIYSNRLHQDLYNIDKVIAGFAEFQRSYSDWKLVVAANGPLTDSLKMLASEVLIDGSYEFVGFVSKEVNIDWYLRSKIWVSVPYSDGTAISLLEAMGYGCIPVVSDLPANKEWVDNMRNGVIINNGVAEGINRAIDLDLQSVQNLNSELVQKRATKKVNRKLFCNIYKDLLK